MNPSRPIGINRDTCWSPEDDDCPKGRDMEEILYRADIIRDEIRDRQAEQRDQEREDQP